MSNYTKLTKHPETGEWLPAHWQDNYFGEHRYGVRFKGSDRVFGGKFETKDEPQYEPPFNENHFVEVKEELTTDYVSVGKTIEEYVPIVWEKLKLGQEVVDLKHKPVKMGKVFKKPYEHCIKVCFYGEFDAITYNKSEIKKHLRLVVKPEPSTTTNPTPEPKETIHTKTTTNKPELDRMVKGFDPAKEGEDKTVERVIKQAPIKAMSVMTDQEQRQHYIKLLEGFDFRPSKNRGYAFEVTIDHDFDNENRRFVQFEKPLGKTRWQANIVEQEDILRDEFNEVEGYNLFIFVTQFVLHQLHDIDEPKYEVDDITFMKDLWTELSKIKNESL